MRYEAAFLSADEQARVHEGSLRILAEVGLRFHGERALPLLRDAGANVDEATGIARIPRAVVEAALATAPRSFVLGARNPVFDYRLPSPVSRYAMDGTAAFMRDFETGERRYGTRLDIEARDACLPGRRHGRARLAAGGGVGPAGGVAAAARVHRDALVHLQARPARAAHA